MRPTERSGPPLLVTGLPRSGTSWVGKMLELSGAVTYVNEPLNPVHPPGHSPGVLAVEPDYQFQYICPDNDADWLPAFTDTLGLRFHLAAELRRNHRGYDIARAAKYMSSFTAGRLYRRRALLDDPYALFSARWFVERLGVRAVVLVRDPVALVGSWQHLGWSHQPEELLNQPLLVRDLIDQPDQLRALSGSTDNVAKIAHLWRVAYDAIDKIREVPGIEVRRYEDLVREPLSGFEQLYQALDLEWTAKARSGIEAATTAAGDQARGFAWTWRGGPSRTAFRPMDSQQALTSHAGRISDQDSTRVREITDDVAQRYQTTV